jgi:heme exporter protein D
MVTSQLKSIFELATGRALGSRDFGSWLFFGLGVLASIVLWSAVVLRQKAMLELRETSGASELARAARALPSMAVSLVLGLLGCAVGLALLVLPGLYLMLAFPFVWQVILFEHRRPVEAFGASRRLMYGNAWRVLTIFCVGLSMLLVFDIIVYMLVAVLLQFAGAGDVTLVTSAAPVVVIALGAITSPFLCALGLATYGDLQVRYTLRTAAAHGSTVAVGADAAQANQPTEPSSDPSVPAERAG